MPHPVSACPVLALSFAEPALLGGLLLVGVPVLLHWLFRRPEREERWAAMEILRRAIARRSSRQRFQTLLLLLVRMMLIASIVLAVARPVLEGTSIGGASRTPTRRTLIIDTSLSMSSREQTQTPLALAKDVAGRILDSATTGDAFRVLKIAPGHQSPIVVRTPSSDLAAVRGEIDRLTQTDGRGDPASALETLVEWIADSTFRGPREVIVVSDFQRTNWTDGPAAARLPGLLETISRRARLILIPVGERRLDNLAISSATVRGGLVRAGVPASVDVTLQNFAAESRSEIAIEVRAGNAARGVARVDVPAGGNTASVLPLTLDPPGLTPIEVRIPDDVLPGDDHFHQVVPVRDRLRVLLVDSGEDSRDGGRASRFVTLALDPQSATERREGERSWFDVRSITALDLSRENLNNVDVLFLCGVPRLTADEGERLERFVRSGGGLIVSASANVDVINANERLFRDGAGVLPVRMAEWVDGTATADRASTLTLPPQPNPIVEPFVGNPDAGLTTTRIWSFLRVDDAAAPILSLANGTPILLEKSLGRGRCLLVTTSLDDRSSNWAVWPSFVPVMQEMTQYAASAGDPRPAVAGEPIEFRPRGVGPFEVRNPRGEVVLRTDVVEANAVLRVDQTELAGIYSLKPAGLLTPGDAAAAGTSPAAWEQAVAVNTDPAESPLDRLTDDELRALLGTSRHVILSDWQPSDRTTATGGNEGNELAGPLMAVVLALALVEGALAWKLAYGMGLLAAVLAAALAWPLAGLPGAIAATGLSAAAVLLVTVRQKWV